MLTFVPIAVPDASYSEMPLTLRGVTYTFTMRYNPRSNGWTADWQDYSGTVLVAGMPIKNGRNLLQPYLKTTKLPYGALFVLDTTGQNQDPALNSFQSTHQLVFVYNG